MAGETTTVSVDQRRFGFKSSDKGLTGYTLTASYATTQLELNDVMEMGYVPGGVTVVGFIVKATDMDTNVSPTLAQKITLDSTDLVTGITVGQTGGSGFYGCVPTATTAATKVTVTNTAAAATAANGTLYVTPVYYST